MFQVRTSLRELILSVIAQVRADQTEIIATSADGVRAGVEETVRSVISANSAASNDEIATMVKEQMRLNVEQTLR